jgi:hypothetical protein
MNKKLNIYLLAVGLLSLLFACEKDETKVTMPENPTPPSIVTVPEMNLTRANGSDTFEFVCKPVDPGFTVSASYFLEADSAGNEFNDAVVVANGTSPLSFKLSGSDLNGFLIKRFPTDVVSAAEFRLRAVFVIDAGTGYEPIISISEVKTASIHTYGLPRLDLIGPAVVQKIESALGDGSYFGFVKLNTAEAFTLRDSETDSVYGLSGGFISVGGPEFAPGANGWHKFWVNTVDHTYTIESYQIGLVGSATPNGWDTPDQKMDYDAKTGTWYITTDVIDGEFKFRLNDGWAWNLGGTHDNLVHNGTNVPITAGNYTFVLTITNPLPPETGTLVLTKNN